MGVEFLESRLGYQLRRASSAMIADLGARLADLDLTVLTMSILIAVDSPAPRTQSDVGRALGIQRANMVPLTAALMDRKLIARTALDGRSLGLVLTPSGMVTLKKIGAVMKQHEAHFLGHVPADERKRLIGVLAGIWRAGEA